MGKMQRPLLTTLMCHKHFRQRVITLTLIIQKRRRVVRSDLAS